MRCCSVLPSHQHPSRSNMTRLCPSNSPSRPHPRPSLFALAALLLVVCCCCSPVVVVRAGQLVGYPDADCANSDARTESHFSPGTCYPAGTTGSIMVGRDTTQHNNARHDTEARNESRAPHRSVSAASPESERAGGAKETRTLCSLGLVLLLCALLAVQTSCFLTNGTIQSFTFSIDSRDAGCASWQATFLGMADGSCVPIRIGNIGAIQVFCSEAVLAAPLPVTATTMALLAAAAAAASIFSRALV